MKKHRLAPSKLGAEANGRQQLTGQFSADKKAVIFLTGMTAQVYEDFQLSTLADWLDYNWPQYGDSEQPASLVLLQSTMLKKWWAFQWQHMDGQKIIPVLYELEPHKRLAAYRCMHQYCFGAGGQCFKDDDRFANFLFEDFRTLQNDFEAEIKAAENEGL